MAFGEVRPAVSTELVAQVGGKVVAASSAFIEGGHFTPDDVLLSIEDTDYRAAMEEVVARVAAAKLELEQALADADVARKQLAAQSNPSPLALREPQKLRELNRRCEQRRLACHSQKLTLSELRSGCLTPEGSKTNLWTSAQYVNPGKVLGTVFGTDVVQVRLPLTTNQLVALAVPIGYQGAADGGLATTLTAKIGGLVHRWQGALTGLDASIDPTTRTVYGTVVIEESYSEISSAGICLLRLGCTSMLRLKGALWWMRFKSRQQDLRAGDKIFVLTGEGLLDIRQADVVHRSRSTALLSAGVEPGNR